MRMFMRISSAIMATLHRRPANLSIDADVLDKARAMNINLSRRRGRHATRDLARGAKRWAEENAEVVRSWNDYVAKNGLPLRKYRSF